MPPVDVLDAMCAQHDYCIERSRYLVGASDRAERLLYPIGVVDDDDFQRCGIPLQSHKNPNYGIRIKACDEEFLVSLNRGFGCAEDPDLPKSPWCFSASLAGRLTCSEHEGNWRYPFCMAAATMARRYQRWKIRNGCSSAAAAVAKPADHNRAIFEHMSAMAARHGPGGAFRPEVEAAADAADATSAGDEAAADAAAREADLEAEGCKQAVAKGEGEGEGEGGDVGADGGSAADGGDGGDGGVEATAQISAAAECSAAGPLSGGGDDGEDLAAGLGGAEPDIGPAHHPRT